MDTLPFELLDRIVDYISEPSDWKACSLISLAWRTPAQIRIFCHCYAETSYQCLRLHHALCRSPHIGGYIWYPSFKIEHVLDAQAVSAVLSFCDHIKRLVIICGNLIWSSSQPYELCDILYKSIFSVLHEQNLVSFWLENCSFAVADLQDMFACASSVENLHISEKFTSRPFDNRPLKETSNRTKLKTLTITVTIESSLLVEWLCSPLCSIDLGELSYLRIEYDPDYNNHIISLISKLLNLVGSSVTDVFIKRCKKEAYSRAPGIPFTFQHNPCIRRLGLALTPYVVWEPKKCPPMWVESSILRLAKPSPIEELIFELEISNYPLEALLGDPLSGIPPHTGWARMASFLTEESFPALRSVEIIASLPWNRLYAHQAIGRREMEGMRMKWAFIVSDTYHRPVLGKEMSEEED